MTHDDNETPRVLIPTTVLPQWKRCESCSCPINPVTFECRGCTGN